MAEATGVVTHRRDPQRVALRVLALSKTYPGTRALDSVELQVQAGTVHALVGGNGSGKSTLIKILAGVVPADPGGTIAVGADSRPAEQLTPAWAYGQRMRFVHQDLGLLGDLTVAENLFLGRRYPTTAGGISWRRVHARARRILDQQGLDLPTTARVHTLRPAEQTILAIARAIDDVDAPDGSRALEPSLLVLDEPTARLPATEAARLIAAMRRLAGEGHGVVFVSHHLDEILDCADVLTVLRDGRHLLTRPTAGVSAAELTALVAGRPTVTERPQPQPQPASRPPVAELRGLTALGLAPMSLDIAAGEIVGLAGLTGSGRTGLLELVCGARRRTGGSVHIDGRAVRPNRVRAAMRSGIAYLPADRASASGFLELPLIENLSAATLREHRGPFGLRLKHERAAGVALLERLDVRAPSSGAVLRQLSGGNQQKVILARWIATRPRLLLLDEPTQGVDVGARDDIHHLIATMAGEGAAVVIVSSDTDELLRLSDRILVLDRGHVTDERPRSAASRSWLDEHFYRANKPRKGAS